MYAQRMIVPSTCLKEPKSCINCPCCLAGPFVEADGTRSPPSFFTAYVVTIPLLLGIVTPTIGLGYLVQHEDTHLGLCTLGVYLVEVVAQLLSEGVFLETSQLLLPPLPSKI